MIGSRDIAGESVISTSQNPFFFCLKVAYTKGASRSLQKNTHISFGLYIYSGLNISHNSYRHHQNSYVGSVLFIIFSFKRLKVLLYILSERERLIRQRDVVKEAAHTSQ